MASRSLHLPIADPCHENWNGMDPVEGGRFCDSCAKQVHDLTELTEGEARGVLKQFAGQRVCVRYRQAADGSLRFKPGRRLAQAAGVAAALSAGACTPHQSPTNAHEQSIQAHDEPDERFTMGKPARPVNVENVPG
ncbi:MAG: hypothetical protein ACPG77_09835, partial [Nannocystaceae bacterium]